MAGGLAWKSCLEAKGINAESSGGRINSDFIEPEALFWEAFYVPATARAGADCPRGLDGFYRPRQ